MEITFQQVAFYSIAILMCIFSVMAITAKRILRAATALLFVLFGTAAMYFMLGYTFLGAVQLMVYAGGIVILYVFSIQLTKSDKNILIRVARKRLLAIILTVPAGAALVLFLIFTNGFIMNTIELGVETPMKEIGMDLIGTNKYQYLLPFEVMSVLLLACMVGGLLIARKR